MIKANNPKAVFGATGSVTGTGVNSKVDSKMTVIKSERKNRKKGKKALKVQEVVENRNNLKLGNHNHQETEDNQDFQIES